MKTSSYIEGWVTWLKRYGLKEFAQHLRDDLQGVESVCIHCGEKIYLDFFEGGGIGDWQNNGDYGCPDSPETNDEGTGGHTPRKE